MVFSGIAGGTIQTDSEIMLTDGVSLYKTGNLEQSLEIFNSITIQDPSWPYGWLWKGTVLADLGKQEEADIAFKTGRCLLNPDSCQEIEEDNKYKSGPHSQEGWNNLKTEYPTGKDAALDNLLNLPVNIQKNSTFLESSPQNPDPNLAEKFGKEGDSQYEKGDLDSALHSYQMAEEMNPENPDYSRKSGDIYKKKEDYASALSAWNRSLQDENNKTRRNELFQKRSDTFSALKQPLDAAKELENVKLPSQNPEVLTRKGSLYSQAGDFSAAEKAYLDSLSVVPGDVDASLGLANVRIQQGKFPEAEDIINSLPEKSLNLPQSKFMNQLKEQIPRGNVDSSGDLSILFSKPDFLLFAIIGVIVIFYFRKRIF